MSKRAKRRPQTQTPDVVDALVKLTGRTRLEAEEVIRVAAQKCYLCSKPAGFVGLFLPDNPQLYGAPDGKKRIIVYGLCETCKAAPGTAEAVDTKALRELGRH